MVTKAAKKAKRVTTRPHRPPAAAPAHSLQDIAAQAGAVALETVFSELLGKVIPNYSAQRMTPDIAARAGLRNGMDPDAVNVAIHRIVESDKKA